MDTDEPIEPIEPLEPSGPWLQQPNGFRRVLRPSRTTPFINSSTVHLRLNLTRNDVAPVSFLTVTVRLRHLLRQVNSMRSDHAES